tara:strand:+ start:1155 stop:1274 length:120 start_codon:yes stop_codon:yes gene_type:complete
VIYFNSKIQNESTHPRLVITPFYKDAENYVGRNEFRGEK